MPVDATGDLNSGFELSVGNNGRDLLDDAICLPTGDWISVDGTGDLNSCFGLSAGNNGRDLLLDAAICPLMGGRERVRGCVTSGDRGSDFQLSTGDNGRNSFACPSTGDRVRVLGCTSVGDRGSGSELSTEDKGSEVSVDSTVLVGVARVSGFFNVALSMGSDLFLFLVSSDFEIISNKFFFTSLSPSGTLFLKDCEDHAEALVAAAVLAGEDELLEGGNSDVLMGGSLVFTSAKPTRCCRELLVETVDCVTDVNDEEPELLPELLILGICGVFSLV